MFYMFDPVYLIIMVVTLALSGFATARVKLAFSKYKKMPAASGKTGQEVAEYILRQQGITNVNVMPCEESNRLKDGMLTDHYDPRSRVVKLSAGVFGSRSIAAQAIAAHEVGHAIQHAHGYAPLQIRNAIVPIANFGSKFSYALIFLGFILNLFAFVKIGILLFGAAVVFQFVTLPVEIDASNRAKKLLSDYNLVSIQDQQGVNAVLNSAALTYVAAAAAALLNLMYLLWRSGILNRR